MKIKYTVESFIKAANIKHNNFYDYSLAPQDFKNIASKIKIICPIHGEFKQNANNHLNGYGCKCCKSKVSNKNIKYTGEKLLVKFKELYGEKYLYDLNLSSFYKVTDKIKFICPNHGPVTQLIRLHLRGNGCKKCFYESKVPTTSGKDIIEKASIIHKNKYLYNINLEKLYYKTEKIEIVCPIHGIFKQQVKGHLEGKGCAKCGREKCRNLFVKSTEEFIKDAQKIHGDRYDYSKTNYVKSNEKVIITCKKHGDFLQKPYSHLHGHGCPMCLEATNNLEKEVLNFVKSLNVKVKANDRTVLFDENTNRYKEIDIFLPEINKGIEFNGIYWHKLQERAKPGYHKCKNALFKKYNIKLLNISDISWIKNKEKVKEKIKKFILL